MRWFEKHLPGDGSVTVETLGTKLCGLSIAGPSARDVLAKVTRIDVSNAAFPFMDIRRADIGMAPCASATSAISATRSGWRRNASAMSSRR